MQPIPFTLEAFRKDMPEAPWGFFNFDVSCPGSLPRISCTGPGNTDPDSGSLEAAIPSDVPLPMQETQTAPVASDSDAASDTASDASVPDLGPSDEVHMVAATGVVHASCLSADARTLCGISTLRSQWQPVLRLASHHTLCRRQACVKAFASLEVP